MRVYAAPFGGPIAISKDTSFLKKTAGGITAKPIIYIFASSGKLLSKINVS
jgi:vacuolar protein sorting-associated protein 16